MPWIILESEMQTQWKIERAMNCHSETHLKPELDGNGLAKLSSYLISKFGWL